MEAYLDWNATTPPAPEVLAAMAEAAAVGWANPSSVHAAGRRARALVEDAREQLASVLGFHPRDVLFCGGGTEANNLALASASTLVTSRLEHPSITRIAERLEARGQVVHWLPVRPEGLVDLDALAALLERAPAGWSVAVTAVCHETGVIQPLPAVAELCARAGAWLHVDAVQALGKLPAAHWAGASSVAVAAHKIRGPKGIGALAFVPTRRPSPLLVGGSQERGLRPGTQDAAACEGFRVALARAAGGTLAPPRLGELRARLERELAAVAVVNGAGAPRLAHVANLSFHGCAADELVAALDLAGVRVSAGSACAAGTLEPSPVITAMVGAQRARSAVRVSLGELTTEAEIELFLAAIARTLRRR